ncbi:MAG: radical SAM family heme chaperone HemW [Selenomonadaceae bacterium]|nr:radical SAM family heme chaperone HemW [Selenomonadaceae bacterium]
MQIYIHVAFCERKCNYCAFNSKVGNSDERSAYVDAVIAEINRRGNFEQVETIYMGGGTPTTLTLTEIDRIICAVRKNFKVNADAEITIEANPGTVDEKYLRGLKSIGFNRLSLGVQSFDDRLLKIIGRIHDSRTAVDTLAIAIKIFDNVSLDLMYGLPTQTLADVRRDINQVKISGVNHVSVYGLEIEEGTKFFSMNRVGKLNLPDENVCADMYDCITKTLPAIGYRRYEVSNFAAMGFESKHNCGYWTGKIYYGFGAGAHSFTGKMRTSNVRDVVTYIERMKTGGEVSTIEEIMTREAAMEEFCFLGLRLVDGISAETFAQKFGTDIFKVFGAVIEKNRRLNLLKVDGDKIFLTERGMSLGNEVFADFLL